MRGGPMKRKIDTLVILGITVAGAAVMCSIIILGFTLDLPLWLIALAGVALGSVVGGIVGILLPRRREINFESEQLPAFAADYIKLVIKYMRYRRSARQEVADELIDHFEAALKDCVNEQEKQKKANRMIEEFGDAKLLGVLMRRAKKRCRPLWRTIVARTFQSIAALIIFLILYVLWFLSGKPIITTDYIAELNKLVRPSADDSLNAAPFYQKAIETLVDVNDIKGLLRTDFNDANDQQKEQIRQWLAKNETPLALISKGAKLSYFWKHYRSDDPNQGIFGVLLPHLADYRTITYALCWRAWLNAENGLYEAAFNDIETCYRLGRHNKGEKILIEQLVGIAIEGRALGTTRRLLDTRKIDSKNLTDFQFRLQQLIDSEDFKFHLQSEKLLMLDEIQRCFTESRFGPSHLYPKRFVEISYGGGLPKGDDWLAESDRLFFMVFFTPFTHPSKSESIDMANAFYEFWDESMSKTPSQLKAEDVNLADETYRVIKKNLVLQVLAPALERIHEVSWRFRIDAESTLVIIALVRYKQDIGNYPKTLDELVKGGYIEQVPTDPFSVSGKPLIYRRTDNDFLLYSFGSNFQDDGGQVVRDEKGKTKRFADEGDWVFWPVEEN
jgi:hypothetical protein